MRNLFTQKQHGHCTVYALANLFRNEDILKKFETEEFKGCDDAKENAIIASIDSGLAFSEIVSVRHSYEAPLPEDFVYTILRHKDPGDEFNIDKQFDLIPYLLTVRLVGHHKFHHAVIVLNKGGTLYYIDPRNELIIKIDNDLFKYFIDCWSIKRPYFKSNDMFARLSSKALGFDLV